MKREWRFIDTGEGVGVFNMEYDEKLATDLISGSGAPTVRVFRWKPWAISLGFNQDETKIDVERCLSEGIDIVRRPTGGRAVFHAQELTYSVVMQADGKSVLDIYNHISRGLVKGLQSFGVQASLAKSQPDFREQYKNPSSIPCFTASARYEIEFDGKKLVGSAQRRYRNRVTREEVVLQHGSILTGPAHRGLAKYLILKNGHSRTSLERDLREKTIDLSDIKQQQIDMNELVANIRRGFEEEWSIAFSTKPSKEVRDA